ncbi:beta-galactosidase [Halegenticoccus soli]|uniref:beta-galactosidase n=1 Tax=Halegenticoccus soli TaxID=1985678 RepID=UPI000C6D3C69|nr:beta-galactosidase [Halegenticoccus soli]
MTIGVCYFPEHWPRDRWETDADQMVEAGIEYVRMAEFSWAVLEPRRGEFDFEWLDEAVEILGQRGLKVVLCTPTATPPKWLVDERPEILQAEPDGTPRGFGSRRHYCFNSPAYRAETERVVSRMVDRYADDPRVVGWQIDNEFGCHGTVRCYCDDCAAAFREWLRDRYDDVDELNRRWGTTFWSQRYGGFEAVEPPRPTPSDHHPSHLLEYYRFASESVVEYSRLQARLVREANAEWFVAHNFMGDFGTLDAHAVSDDLDLVAWDSYPTGFPQYRRPEEATPDELRAGDPDQVGVNHDLYRGTNGEPFWVMEQQPGDINWPPHAPQPAEGAMRLWAHHATAHGADAVLYFRWRRCLEGQEQYHAGLRKADGSPDRGYDDARRAAKEIQELPDLASVDAPVALLHGYENHWALSIQPHSPDFEYWSHARTYYRALRERGVQVDVVHPRADLDGYAAVVAPTLHLVDDALASHLRDYVEAGGELLLTIRSGVKDPWNKLRAEPAPGPLADLVGATVERHESLPDSIAPEVSYSDGSGGSGRSGRSDQTDRPGRPNRTAEPYPARTWAEWLAPGDATVVGTHESGVAAGRPAIVRNDVGSGSATHVGTWPEADLAAAVAGNLLDRAGVGCADRFPTGVRAAERDGFVWITNFTSDPVRISAPADAAWVVGDAAVGAFDVSVVEADLGSVSVDRSCRSTGTAGRRGENR